MDSVEKVESIRHQVQFCRDCHLAETRQRTVFGSGNPASKLMIVAEGPSARDEQTGQPFTGPAGVLLDDVLAENQLSREQVWLTNLLKCRAFAWKDGQFNNRPPKSSEIRSCNRWLSQEVSLITPTVILCMGTPAAKFIIRPSFRLAKERGVWFLDNGYAPFVSATYNPAYVLRMPGLGKDFYQGRQLLVQDIAGAKLKLKEVSVKSQLNLFPD